MTYTEALDFIRNSNKTFCKPGTERVQAICRLLGDPQNDLRFVHVAGTNGKGSFCAMLEAVLLAAGYKVGVFSSPAVLDFCEQIRVLGKPIAPDALAALTAEAKPLLADMPDPPTEFELLTALAFRHFANEACDIVILEAGLGGRLDATNVIETPILSVITGIALDHTAFLGDTVAAIAREKAGIARRGVPLLFGGDDVEARGVIADAANAMQSPYFFVKQEDIRVLHADLNGTHFDYAAHRDVFISLLGLYQPQNAATVIAACDILHRFGLPITDAQMRRGLADARWRARFEKISRDPLVIFDGAHNPQGIAAAVRSIRAYFGENKILLVTGVLRDKDYRQIALSLASVACEAFTITPDSPRALSAAEYAETLRKAGLPSTACDTVADAFAAAKKAATERNLPVVCLGSLYLYQSVAPLF